MNGQYIVVLSMVYSTLPIYCSDLYGHSFKSETLHKQSSVQVCDMMKFKISFHNLWSELFFVLTMFQVLWKTVDSAFSRGDKLSPMEEDISIW
jgi:hypothetical protein